MLLITQKVFIIEPESDTTILFVQTCIYSRQHQKDDYPRQT